MSRLLRGAVICGALLLMASWQGRAQQAITHEVTLRFPVRQMRLDSLGKLLEGQAGLVLSFNASVTSPGKIIRLPAGAMQVSALVSYLKTAYRLGGALYGNHLVLRPLRGEAPPPAAASRKPGPSTSPGSVAGRRSRPPVGVSHRPLPGRSISPAAVRRAVPSAVQPLKILAVRVRPAAESGSPELPARVPSATTVPPERAHRPAVARQPESAIRNPRKISGREGTLFEQGFYGAAGVSGDDVWYVGPEVRAGMPWLFGLVSWKTDFEKSAFSYGVGSFTRIRDNWRLGVTATTQGKLSRSFAWADTDTTTAGFSVKSTLKRISLVAGVMLGSHFALEAGPQLNFLKTVYKPGTSSSVTATLPSREDLTTRYQLLKPLYTLTDRYSADNTVNHKSWIGLKVGLFYRF